MAKTTRDYKPISKSIKYINQYNVPKFPKGLVKTWSMESKARDAIKEAGYNPSNRLLSRNSSKYRNTFTNSSFKELVKNQRLKF